MTAPRLPLAVLVPAALFVLVIGYLVAVSLVPRRVATFPPSPPTARTPLETGATDTVTVDARDERAWAFFDLERRSVVAPPDTAGWDLAFQRHRIIAARGIRDLGRASLDSVTAVPDTGYVSNDARSSTTNRAIRDWYRYSFLSHLLEPSGHAYATPTGNGRYAAFEILGYYCPGPEAGCVTLRYKAVPAGR